MNARPERGWDFVPAGVAAAACATAVGYIRLMDAQGDRPSVWLVGGLTVAAALAAYAAIRSAPHRAEAIGVSGVVLMAYGILAALSIGLPILVAGVLALAFALKTREEEKSS